MRRIYYLSGLLLFVSILFAWHYDFVPVVKLGQYTNLGDKNYKIVKNPSIIGEKGCLRCHSGIEMIDRNHNFSCTACHGGNPDAVTMKEAHRGMVRDPGAPENWGRCEKCHGKEIEALKNSLHYTMSGVINGVMYQLGAEKKFGKISAASVEGYKILRLTHANLYPESLTELAPHLLRGKCFQCHISAKPPAVEGVMRGRGCSACHVYYANDGIYRGGDKSLSGKKGYPLYHQFTSKIPLSTCMHCHHGHFIGGDYAGLYERNYHRRYRADLAHKGYIEGIYGMDYLHLESDVHFKAGMHCADCHGRSDVMGDGTSHIFKREAVRATCSMCHMPWRRGRKTGLKRDKKGWYFVSKVTGKKFYVPVYKRKLIYHRIPGHEKLSCVACHARWGEQDYGWNLVREDNPQWAYWQDYFLQGDPWIYLQFHNAYMRSRFCGESPRKCAYPPPATMGVDWLTGRKIPGIWFSGYMMRRWEDPPLGFDEKKGKFYPARPEFQFYISYDDVVTGGMVSNYFAIYSPHTISPYARSCESCHGNPKTAGMGIRGFTKNGRVSNWQVYPLFEVKGFYKPEERMLTPGERKDLLYPGKKYRWWRWKVFR